MKQNVIIVDPEKFLTRHIGKTLQASGIDVVVFGQAESAFEGISSQWNGVLVAPLNMPVMGGLEFLEKVKNIDPDIPVLIIIGYGDDPQIINALRLGAYDIIEKSFPNRDINKNIRRALEKRRLVLENRELQSEIAVKEKSESFVAGRSIVMERLCKTISRAAEVDADVLLVGETGTGKELVARCLHEQSKRRHTKFVTINCCAIPEENLESELFGREPEGFTGPQHRRIGKFEYSEGGTIYLDEIDSMPLHLQAKLIRVLQERMVEKLGLNHYSPIDIRVIASTKMDLKKASEAGTFRGDLYCHLNIIQIPLPPLRDHREDIPLLFEYFVLQACAKYQRPGPLINDKILQDLLRRDWPGNVRELKNAAERFTLGYDLDSLNSDDQGETVCPNEQSNRNQRTLVEKMNDFEKSLIAKELARTGGNVKATYLTLGLPRKTFYEKMKKHSLKRKDFLEPMGNMR